MFDLLNITHNQVLPLIIDCLPIEFQLMCQMSKFIIGCLSSQNMPLRLLTKVVTKGNGYLISKRFISMLFKCGITHNMFCYNYLTTITKRINIIHSPYETLYYRAVFARTIVYERDTTAICAE